VEKDLRTLVKYNSTLSDNLKRIGKQNDTISFRHQIKSSIHEAVTLSQNIDRSFKELPPTNTKTAVDKLRKVYQEQVTKLQQIVEKKIKTEESQYQPQLESDLPLSTENYSQETFTTKETNYNRGNQVSQTQTQDLLVAQYGLAEMERREDQIHQMVDDLGDLQTMYHDLNVLVHDQQEHVDNLETNVEEAGQQVASGTQHLVVASDHQRAYRKKMCYVLMILLIVAAVIVVFIFGVGQKKMKTKSLTLLSFSIFFKKKKKFV